jgi:hypothetical protein
VDVESHLPLRISETDGRVRLCLDGFSYVEGATLQDAADKLVTHLLEIAMALRATGVGPIHPECCPDPAQLDFISEFGELVAAGGDPRDLLFGPKPPAL